MEREKVTYNRYFPSLDSILPTLAVLQLYLTGQLSLAMHNLKCTCTSIRNVNVDTLFKGVWLGDVN